MAETRPRRTAWLVAALFVVVGLCAWLFWSAGRSSGHAGPPSVVVDASRLPVTVTVSGVKVTVQSVCRKRYAYGDNVAISVSAEDRDTRRRLVRDTYVAVTDEGEVTPSEWTGLGGVPNGIDEVIEFPTKPGASQLDFSFCGQSFVPGGTTKIVLKNISASGLPITGKGGSCSVTIQRVYIYEKGGNGYVPMIGLDCTQSGPPDNFAMVVTSDGQDWPTESRSVDPYWLAGDSVVVDQQGKAFAGSCVRWGETAGARDVFAREAGHLTELESLVSKLSRRKAASMITNRAMRAAMSANRTYETEAVLTCDRLPKGFILDRVPKRFTFEKTIDLPRREKKRVRVLFKHIPIPPK